MKDCEQMTAPESSDDIELWMKVLSGNATVAELASGDPESIKGALLLRTAIQSRVIRDFNAAINFAIKTDEPREFLRRWREGNRNCLRKEWPEFELPPMCSGYPDCKTTLPDAKSKPGKRSAAAGKVTHAEEPTSDKVGATCPTCEKGTLVLRVTKSAKNPGKHFLGCTRYPHCKHFEWVK